MFDLEQSIAEWRRRMLAEAIKNAAVMDELESHLREDVERQMKAGSSGREAFEAAVQRIGQPGSLKCEFEKVRGRKWALLRTLKGIFFGALVPVPSVGTFSPSALRTLEVAREEAPRLQHDFIGTEHILLGLLTLESGVVPSVLERMGVDRGELRKQVEKWVSSFPYRRMRDHIPYTPRAEKALRIAAQEARAGKQACVGAEHIFLGLIIEGDGVAGRVLKNLGVNVQTARREIQSELGRNQGGG
jgi:hypothetical protein